ncbi:MAG: hypothetical protein AAGJ79_06005 [Verrucomicrobiota bacterium]
MSPGGLTGGGSPISRPSQPPEEVESELEEDLKVEDRRLRRQQARWAKEASLQKNRGLRRGLADLTEMLAPRLMVFALVVASFVAAWRLLQD